MTIMLPRDFYNQDTITVATSLLGKQLVHVVNGLARVGRIVEVEAYLGPRDLAAHSSKGITPRTRVMFGPPGFAYVYLIYGIYHCFNVVTEEEGSGTAVLIRALEPLQHLQTSTKGPGLLCKAMDITTQLSGHDLVSETLYLAEGDALPFEVVQTTRVGVDYAKEWRHEKLRFYIKNNPFVSRK